MAAQIPEVPEWMMSQNAKFASCDPDSPERTLVPDSPDQLPRRTSETRASRDRSTGGQESVSSSQVVSEEADEEGE